MVVSGNHLRDETSFPDVPYPSLRDSGAKDSYEWIRGKALDDGAEGLWRVHDGLYDLSDFVDSHPGGADWLKITKGTDITELFETHHPSSLVASSLLTRHLVRRATAARRSPFTFAADGFYRTLKARSAAALATVPRGPAPESCRITDALLIATFASSACACCASAPLVLRVALVLLAGVCLAWTVICAHNFTHMRDNWRMYLVSFMFANVRSWRIMHIVSHHMYPNTLFDAEISFVEPHIKYMPRSDKTFIDRHLAKYYYYPLAVFMFDFIFLIKMRRAFSDGFTKVLGWDDLVPFTLPLAMYAFGTMAILDVLIVWTCIFHVASFAQNVIGQNAAHHHPDIFHDGDEPMEDRDWGLHQLHAVMDRTDVDGSLFAVMTSYGRHGMHHMFPTIDHAHLPMLYDAFADTCRDFGVELRMSTRLQLMIGHFRQIARTERKIKPKT